MLQPDIFLMALNVGSSSLKFAVFQIGQEGKPVYEGEIDRIGLSGSLLRVTSGSTHETQEAAAEVPGFPAAVKILMDWVRIVGIGEKLSAVGHRMVHGGSKYLSPERITPEMLSELRLMSPFDPDHLPGEIMLADAFLRQFPSIPQVACFDTAFHRNMPRVARILPIPRRYEAAGIRRYGFHGLSYEFLMEELARRAGPELAKKRVVLAHLGSGVSLAAVNNGRSFDTSMSFSPASGVPMGTRSGDIDPGFVWYLARNEHLSGKEINQLLIMKSGLLGVSDISSDMKDLLDLEDTNVQASEAISFFTYQIKKWLGGFIAVLGGVDCLVFSGGIGERSSTVRARICEGLECMDLYLDIEGNLKNNPVISRTDSRVKIHIIHTDEERVIARMVSEVMGLGWAA